MLPGTENSTGASWRASRKNHCRVICNMCSIQKSPLEWNIRCPKYKGRLSPAALPRPSAFPSWFSRFLLSSSIPFSPFSLPSTQSPPFTSLKRKTEKTHVAQWKWFLYVMAHIIISIFNQFGEETLLLFSLFFSTSTPNQTWLPFLTSSGRWLANFSEKENHNS